MACWPQNKVSLHDICVLIQASLFSVLLANWPCVHVCARELHAKSCKRAPNCNMLLPSLVVAECRIRQQGVHVWPTGAMTAHHFTTTLSLFFSLTSTLVTVLLLKTTRVSHCPVKLWTSLYSRYWLLHLQNAALLTSAQTHVLTLWL